MRGKRWNGKVGVNLLSILKVCHLSVLFLPFASCNHERRAYKEGDVILGGLFNLHFAGTEDHCGDLFTMGLGHAEAMIFAIESVNKNPRLLPNVTLGYDIRDYCERTALAMKITYSLVRTSDQICMPFLNFSSTGNITTSKPISALVGPYNSGSAVLVGSLLQVAPIPAISPTATSVELSSPLYNDFFRTVPPDNWQAKVMADIIEHFNWTYVAAVGVDDSYGRNGIWALEQESYDRKSFCVAFSEFIPRLKFQEKIKQTVLRIKKKSSIGVIIVWLSGGKGRAFLKEASDQNLQGKTLILSDALTAEEAVFLDPRFPVLDGSLGIQPRDYQDSSFEEHLKRITPTKSVESGMIWWEEFWSSHFNCSGTKFNDSNIPACDANLTLNHAVTKIRSSFVSYLIDAVYALGYALNSIYNCSTTNDADCPSVQPFVKGSDVQKFLRNVSFPGVTGRVQFDSSGDPLSASYDIINFQRVSTIGTPHRKVLVGYWDKETTPKLRLNELSLRWGSLLHNLSIPVSFCARECSPGTMQSPTTPCCWECITCPQGTISTGNGSSTCTECHPDTKPNDKRSKCEDLTVINIPLISATGVGIIVITSIGVLLLLLTLLIYFKFYNTPIVKASSREMSFLLLFGIMTLFALAVLELVEPGQALCYVVYVGRYFALNLCVTVLFLKTMRITSVFQVDKVAELFTPCFKTIQRQTMTIIFMNSVALSLIALWMMFDPPRREKIIRPDEYIFLVCKPFRFNTGYSLFLAVCSYTSTVALLCTYYAFKARDIPENFNEAKYIGFSMYILLLSSLAYYPVVFNFESWYVTLVACSTTLVSSFGLLICMYGPKMYILVLQPQRNTLECVRSQVSQYSFHKSRSKVWAASTSVGSLSNVLSKST
ncbi:extracellular calcium-sensing receptor-like [Stylophora pistillata]|nr:extracellular calcium-sensing receptor-like [Stylophora pistillata]